MRVLLINPRSPYLENDAAYPPMGLLYIAAVIESCKCSVCVADTTTMTNDEIHKFPYSDYDLIGITCVTPNVDSVNYILSLLPPHIPVMIGGAHPTFVPAQIYNHPNYFIVIGECELIIPQILKDAKNKCIKSIYNQGCVTPVKNIPPPLRVMVDMHLYTPGGEKTTPVYTSRGCPYHCAFCSKITNDSYRMIPESQVMDEIFFDCIDLGFKHILIGDDNFIINIPRAIRLLQDIGEYNIKFRLNQDARTIRDDVFLLASKSGCESISFGIESGSQTILNNMNKQTTVEQNLKAINMAHDHNMDVKIYLVSNFPGETDKTIEETIDFVRKAEPDKWMISNFAPLPGCDVFNNPSKYGIDWISNKWSEFFLVGKNAGFIPSFTTKELNKDKQIYLHDKLYKGLVDLNG
jgi:anaerobic magnesium-protoporphyrin IX monomethyl ester cyclase